MADFGDFDMSPEQIEEQMRIMQEIETKHRASSNVAIRSRPMPQQSHPKPQAFHEPEPSPYEQEEVKAEDLEGPPQAKVLGCAPTLTLDMTLLQNVFRLESMQGNTRSMALPRSSSRLPNAKAGAVPPPPPMEEMKLVSGKESGAYDDDDDSFHIVQCLGCKGLLSVDLKSSLVLCPQCWSISPAVTAS